ncbi:hypothetical protein [Streptomyces niveiscabiei]|uniref:Uncharacterized protein n=1 Tax=Streptomyces niveiscabiei TaxID=164115 RepID=A0ABW9I4E0_9ACTN
MNTSQPIYVPRAGQAIHGARRARQRTEFVRVVASQLDQIAPGTARVLVTPVTSEGRTRKVVALEGVNGAVEADRAQHAAAYGLLTRAFPLADWSRPRVYDVRTGVLSVNEPFVPAELGLDSSGGAR